MKIVLSCGEVEIKPLPVHADRVIELLDALQGLGSKDNPFPTKKSILLEIIYFAGKSQEDLIMADIMIMIERFGEILAAALPFPQSPLLERITRQGDEVLNNGDEALAALTAAGIIHVASKS